MSSSSGRTWTYPGLGEQVIVVETERDGRTIPTDVDRRPLAKVESEGDPESDVEPTGRAHYSEFMCAKCGEPMRFRYCLNCRDLEDGALDE